MTAGWGLGGAIAHALAGRLLLQVREEVELAQKMGINLESLSQTEGKVRVQKTSWDIVGTLCMPDSPKRVTLERWGR